MISLPVIDYSPLTKKWLSTMTVRKELRVENIWLFDEWFSDEEIKKAARLYQFALENNFGFIGNFSGRLPFPESHFHSLATLNYPIMLTYGVIMQLEDGWLEIGQLRLGTAPGQNSRSAYFTYVKVTLRQNLPDLTIDSRSEGLPTHAIGKKTYATESGEFNQLFKLYLGKEPAQDSLKVLSPDVMSILIDHFRQFDIEMRGHTISLITRNHDLTDPNILKDVLEMTAALIDELTYQVRSPVAANTIPQDIASYKALYGYTREPEAVIQAKARHETRKTFLYSIGITFFLFAIVFLIVLLSE